MSLLERIRGLFFLLLFLTTATTFAQKSPLLGNFDLSKSNEKVFLNWSITAGSLCNGIQIFRSTDNENFELIGGIAGICGDISSTISYTFTDNKPVKNKINYYKLELGSPDESGILSIEITDIEENGYQVRPNPVVDRAKIYFNNDKGKEHYFSLYNLSGQQVFFTTTEQDIIEVDTETLSSGIYFFTIIGGGNPTKISGKILVQ